MQVNVWYAVALSPVIALFVACALVALKRMPKDAIDILRAFVKWVIKR
ncbi:MAG TPA: hypothetical protein PLV82_03635 [bacterium]|nr:hypothetical protein [bacterium]